MELFCLLLLRNDAFKTLLLANWYDDDIDDEVVPLVFILPWLK